MAVSKLDKALKSSKRSLRTLPKALLLGPTGARLWADYLNPVPGFSGAIDFIHKINIPLLFTVENNLEEELEPCKADWYPSHLYVSFESSRLFFSEKKFITWNDCAVSCQIWENRFDKDIILKLVFPDGFERRPGGNRIYGTFDASMHGFIIDTVISFNLPDLTEGISISPGEKVNVIIAAACGIQGLDSISVLEDRADSFIKSGMPADEIVKKQEEDYGRWFENTPEFECSDVLLNKTWLYRLFILRHNLADPKFGYLKHILFYEGRSHKMSKKPFQPKGWEFSKMIPLSTPMNILDARWFKDPSFCEGILRNLKDNQDEDGFFSVTLTNRHLHSFANFNGWAAYQFYLIHRNKELVMEILPSMKRHVDGWMSKLGNEKDSLIIEYIHQHTGKEYQPSYWYFHGFPKDCKDKSQYTPLKRVDRSVYHYFNLQGVIRLCEEVGDPDAEKYKLISEKLKHDILTKMWDEDTKFFYDLHFETDEKAMVKNIVGFYPYWARITGDEHDRGWEHLFSDEFNTGCPFPSVSTDCPAYQAEGGWQGIFIKGRNGCVWDGPTWPYTNCIVLDALAEESKNSGHRFDKQFAKFLKEYSFLHYTGRDINRPYLVEHYNSRTGEPLSDEVDYNHSYYIDLIIRHVVGLEVGKDKITLNPVDIGLDYFILDNLTICGMDIKVSYKRPGFKGGRSDIPEGYMLHVNGKICSRSAGLEKLEYSI